MIYGESGDEDFESVPLAPAPITPLGGKIVALIRPASVALKQKISAAPHRLKQEHLGAAACCRSDFLTEIRNAGNIVDIASSARSANLISSRGHRRFISTRPVFELIDDENA